MHHDLAWCLNLLEAIESNIVEITGAVQISLLISHYLLEEVVPPRLSLLFLDQQIVSRGNLIMFVVLNICNCLVEITVWRDARSDEAILHFPEELLQDWHSVLADDDTLHLL